LLTNVNQPKERHKMDTAKLKRDIEDAYKLCDKDYTCKPQIKAWLNYVQAANDLRLPIYIEQSSLMFRFFREIGENGTGKFYDQCMSISLGYSY